MMAIESPTSFEGVDSVLAADDKAYSSASLRYGVRSLHYIYERITGKKVDGNNTSLTKHAHIGSTHASYNDDGAPYGGIAAMELPRTDTTASGGAIQTMFYRSLSVITAASFFQNAAATDTIVQPQFSLWVPRSIDRIEAWAFLKVTSTGASPGPHNDVYFGNHTDGNSQQERVVSDGTPLYTNWQWVMITDPGGLAITTQNSYVDFSFKFHEEKTNGASTCSVGGYMLRFNSTYV